MRKLTFKLLLAITFLNLISFQAQSQKDEIAVIQSIWGMEKRAIVTDYMKLSTAEATAFWPIYDSYQTEYQSLGKERIMAISDYANNVNSLTNEKADEIIMKLFKNNIQVDKLQKKYYKKLKGAMTALRAAQFMQLEYYLQTTIRSEIQNSIPMIGELDKKAK